MTEDNGWECGRTETNAGIVKDGLEDKYLVINRKDIERLEEDDKAAFHEMVELIEFKRGGGSMGRIRGPRKYLVLKMEDPVDVPWLRGAIGFMNDHRDVRHIAHELLGAIWRARWKRNDVAHDLMVRDIKEKQNEKYGPIGISGEEYDQTLVERFQAGDVLPNGSMPEDSQQKDMEGVASGDVSAIMPDGSVIKISGMDDMIRKHRQEK